MSRTPSRLRRWASALVRELTVLAIAYRDPRTPFAARALTAVVLAYALSPIDLIPDAIPVVGLLDDVLLVPLGVALILRLLPPEVVRDARRDAAGASLQQLRRSLGRWGTAAVAGLWLATLLLAFALVVRWLGHSAG